MSDSQKSVISEFSVFEEMGSDIFFQEKSKHEKTKFDFTRWWVSHVWLLASGPFILLLLIDILVGVISPSRQILSELLVDLTDVYFISLNLLVLVGGLIFRHILQQTPKTFLELAKNGLLEKSPVRKSRKPAESRPTFSSKFRADVMGRGRWVTGTILLILGIPLIIYADLSRNLGLFANASNLFNTETSSLILLLDTLWLFTRWVFTPVLWVIAFGPGVWILYTIGAAIKDLTPQFNLALQPSHPDGCGGLRRLGDLCFSMALPLLLAILLSGIWVVVGVRNDPQDPVTIASILGLAIAIVLSIVVFFVPLWDIHLAMLAKRTRYQDDLAERMNKTEKKLQENFKKVKPDSTDSLAKELKTLQELHPTARKYPVWPFDWGIFVKVISPSTVSILGVIFSLNKDVLDSLKVVLQPLFDLIGGK